MRQKNVLWITRTAIFIAILIVFQFVTKSVDQLVTGSLVNLVLITSVVAAGIASGAAVALLSPVFAFLVGIGPAIPQIVPLIMLGNLAIVVVVWLFAERMRGALALLTGIVAGALLKFAVLWFGFTKIVLQIIPSLKPQQIQTLTVAFSWRQLVTALIGGALAMLVVPALKKALGAEARNS